MKNAKNSSNGTFNRSIPTRSCSGLTLSVKVFIPSDSLQVFIFDERLPVLVSVFVHLHEIKIYIVRQVICKIAITGHCPRSISDDVAARHIEWGARLICLFAELGNFFPTTRSFNLLSLTVLPDRSASAYVFARMRS